MCERTDCFAPEDYFQWICWVPERTVKCVCMCARSQTGPSGCVRRCVCCVGGTFWSVGGKPIGGDGKTGLQQQATVPPRAFSSSLIISVEPSLLHSVSSLSFPSFATSSRLSVVSCLPPLLPHLPTPKLPFFFISFSSHRLLLPSFHPSCNSLSFNPLLPPIRPRPFAVHSSHHVSSLPSCV